MLPPQSRAPKDWGHIATYGAGNVSCGQWTVDAHEGAAAHWGELAWVEGFVTGSVLALPLKMKDTDEGGMAGAVDNYCLANPLKRLTDAARDLVIQLYEHP